MPAAVTAPAKSLLKVRLSTLTVLARESERNPIIAAEVGAIGDESHPNPRVDFVFQFCFGAFANPQTGLAVQGAKL
jgi:hypothetical protein